MLTGTHAGPENASIYWRCGSSMAQTILEMHAMVVRSSSINRQTDTRKVRSITERRHRAPSNVVVNDNLTSTPCGQVHPTFDCDPRDDSGYRRFYIDFSKM